MLLTSSRSSVGIAAYELMTAKGRQAFFMPFNAFTLGRWGHLDTDPPSASPYGQEICWAQSRFVASKAK
jgi:hypothetical protein